MTKQQGPSEADEGEVLESHKLRNRNFKTATEQMFFRTNNDQTQHDCCMGNLTTKTKKRCKNNHKKVQTRRHNHRQMHNGYKGTNMQRDQSHFAPLQ